MTDAVLDVETPVVGPRYVDARVPGPDAVAIVLVNQARDRCAVVDLARETPSRKELRIVLEPGEEATATLTPGFVRIKLGDDARLELR